MNWFTKLWLSSSKKEKHNACKNGDEPVRWVDTGIVVSDNTSRVTMEGCYQDWFKEKDIH